MRQVVLDTETTGLEVSQGHRIIEIGCLELVNRRHTQRTFHRYLNPEREIDAGAEQVHGLSRERLSREPRFAEVAADLLAFLDGAELVIHNADFDIGFLEHEFRLAGHGPEVLKACCTVIDTLAIARRLHPGQRNSLDALCKRYAIDNSLREHHGALLDARLLADVYLAMTGGQGSLSLDAVDSSGPSGLSLPLDRSGLRLPVVMASDAEVAAHEAQLDALDKSCREGALWRLLADANQA